MTPLTNQISNSKFKRTKAQNFKCKWIKQIYAKLCNTKRNFYSLKIKKIVKKNVY